MESKGTIFHNDAFFTTLRAGLHAGALGENVAADVGIDAAHQAFMKSAGHRANILDARFRVAGFAVVWDGTGMVYITEDFVQPAASASAWAPPVPAASRVARPPSTPIARPRVTPHPNLQPVSTHPVAPVVVPSTTPATNPPAVAPAYLSVAPVRGLDRSNRVSPFEVELVAAAFIALSGAWIQRRMRRIHSIA
jgi:hypothetical protein